MTRLPRAELENIDALRVATLDRSGRQALADLEVAYALAERLHRGEMRRSGDPYVSHCVAVARLVLEWGQPLNVVCAALLHDAALGPHRALVADLLGRDAMQMIAAMTSTQSDQGLDQHAAFLNIADRLHNARTWEWVPRKLCVKKAVETLASVVPLAAALGLPDVAQELEDRSVLMLGRRSEWAAVGLSQMSNAGVSLGNRRTDRLAARIYRAAVRIVPGAHRRRYAEEWAGDLVIQPGARARAEAAVGMAVAAVKLRCAGDV